MEITAVMVKELREATSAGILDCRKALVSADGDFDKAVDFLREKGLFKIAKRSGREANDGLISTYTHNEGRIGVLVEVNCETDFVARTDEFKNMVNDIAMQIAAMYPKYIKREDVPESVIEHERTLFKKQALEEGKPERVIERIVEGRLEKFYQESCLLEQSFIRDDDKTINDLLNDQMAKVGENMRIRRFERFELGESLGE